MPINVVTDLRHLFGSARDQGQRPTCMAFAASDAHAAARGPYEPLSVEFAHYQGIRRKAIFDPSKGVPLHLMMAAIRDDGQPLEAGWPYLLAPPSDIGKWSPPPEATPVFYRGSTLGSPLVPDVLSHIDAGRPVIVVVKISRVFHFAVMGKTITNTPQDTDTGLHAMVAVGHGHEGADKVVLLRNSWGTSWCDNGHAWVSQHYLAGRLLGIAVIS